MISKVGRATFVFSKHLYQPHHGPRLWPWWKLFTIHMVRHGQYFEETRNSYGWNIWFYSRWGAFCQELSIRRK